LNTITLQVIRRSFLAHGEEGWDLLSASGLYIADKPRPRALYAALWVVGSMIPCMLSCFGWRLRWHLKNPNLFTPKGARKKAMAFDMLILHSASFLPKVSTWCLGCWAIAGDPDNAPQAA